MEFTEIKHPLVADKVTTLRDKNTDTATFRRVVNELAMLVACEATRTVRVHTVEVATPLTVTSGERLATPLPMLIPILRAGLGLLDGFLQLMPNADTGFLGMKRNEETLQPVVYMAKMPADLSGRQIILLDPMLATGGSLTDAIRFVAGRGAADIICATLICAPEGVAALRSVADEITVPIHVFTAVLDDHLNEHGYIVPGLGDAGDRLYGAPE